MLKGFGKKPVGGAGTVTYFALVADGQTEPGQWLTQSEYVAMGCTPDFDSLPVLVRVVQRAGSIQLTDEQMAEFQLPVATNAQES